MENRLDKIQGFIFQQAEIRQLKLLIPENVTWFNAQL